MRREFVSAPSGVPPEIVLQPASARQTTEWITILSAAGFDYRLSRTARGWVVHVPADRAEAARREIEAVEAVNRGWPPIAGGQQAAESDRPVSWSPVWVAVFLTGFYAWLGPYDSSREYFQRAAVDAERMLEGEWWRAVTALTVHADADHLAGNALSILLLGFAACRRLGAGLSWLLILTGGFLGNAGVAVMLRRDHVSVGASTACFAAIGILSARTAAQCFRSSRRWISIWNRSWLPVAAGLALMALTGSAPGSDLSAHLLGLGAGLLLGVAFSSPQTRGLANRVQAGLQLIALLAVLAAWSLAWG